MNPPEQLAKTKMPSRSVGRRFVLIGLALIGLAFLLWFGSMGYLAWSLQGRAARLVQMANDPKTLSLAVATNEVHGARQELTLLRGEMSPLLWFGARLGGDAGAAEPLADAGVEAITAGDDALTALAPALGDMSLSSLSMSSIPRVLDAIVTARPALARARSRLDLAAITLSHIRGPLSPTVEKGVNQATKLVELARQGMGGALVAPELLGRDESRTYLVLVQNSDELRASGGFISNVGRIELKHGTVISQTFQDSYSVDDFTKYYPDPPKPIFDYMAADQWVFRDSNWSPDFPTAARDAIRLYQVSRPEKIDGVIAINQKTVQMLMGGLEPLDVQGLAEQVTSANALQIFQDAWNPAPLQPGQSEGTATLEWALNRKQFVGSAVRAAMDKLFTGKVNWMRLAQGLGDAMRQRQMLIYTSGPEAAQLGEMGWDGGLHFGLGDYLMVVDSNVGFGKVAPLIAESVDYWVTLQPDGTGLGTVTLDYQHRGKQQGVVCSPYLAYDTNMTYEKMVHRCYTDYVRLMVPLGSHLKGADAHPAPGKYFPNGKDAHGIAETLADEAAHSGFGQVFVLEYGQHLQTRFQYALPKVVTSSGDANRYSLYLQKQPGTDALPVRTTVTLPAQARIVSVNPAPDAVSGTTLEFELTLNVDAAVEVTYVLAH